MKEQKPENAIEDLETDLLLEAIRRFYGYDFSNYERIAVNMHIRECMLAARVRSISRLQEKVLREPAFLDRFVRTFSNSGHAMFSEPSFYESLRCRIVPMLRTYPFVRVWHVGCSTGEEVYSMAILLEEEGFHSHYRIYATDLSEEAIKQARRGAFPASLAESYASNYMKSGGIRGLLDHFRQRGNRLLAKSALKKAILFSEHNLATDGSLNEFHLIVCRNVLSSFNQSLRERVDALIYDSLARLGVLALGAGDSLNSMPHGDCYAALDESTGLYQKIGPQSGRVDLGFSRRSRAASTVRC